jgi:hypothetical protein
MLLMAEMKNDIPLKKLFFVDMDRDTQAVFL